MLAVESLGPEPRCCRTHALEHRRLCDQLLLPACSSQDGAPPFTNKLSADELADLDVLHESSRGGDSWLVIVGGEHGSIMREDTKKTRPGPFLAGHCSLQWVGIVFERLLQFFGRDRIVVVAQLDETLGWLRHASASEEAAERIAGRQSLLPMLRNRLADVERDCARLISMGGADYDGADVNPSTVLRVLRGCPPRPGGRAVPQSGVSSIVLVMVSHGHAHPSFEGAKTHEWYMHLPYPTPAAEDSLYDVVSYKGFECVDPEPEWDWGASKHRWKLYGQMLFQAHHEVLERSPWRRLVLFHQFCLSGGAANFMRQLSYQSFFGTPSWPVFVITTAGRFEPSLGNFVGLWTKELAEALEEGGSRTLEDVYRAAERQYWKENAVLLELNESGELENGDGAQPPPDSAASSVGTIAHHAGTDPRLALPMGQLPVVELINSSCSGQVCEVL